MYIDFRKVTNRIADKFSSLYENEGVYIVRHKKYDRPLYVGQSKNIKRRLREHLKESQNFFSGIFYELALLEIKNNGVWAQIYDQSQYKYELPRIHDIRSSLIIEYSKDIEFEVVSQDIKTERDWILKLNPICNKYR